MTDTLKNLIHRMKHEYATAWAVDEWIEELEKLAVQQGWQPIATCPYDVEVWFGWNDTRPPEYGTRYKTQFYGSGGFIPMDEWPRHWIPVRIPEPPHE